MRSVSSRWLGKAAFGLSFLGGASAIGSSASAEDGAASANALFAYANLNIAGADGERSWLDGGSGKLRFGAGARPRDRAFEVRPYATEAGVAWQPDLSWSLGATAAVVAQRGQQHDVDLSEAFLTFRPMPLGDVRISARAGLMWPPVSLEHGGAEWRVRDTVTPSAINAWIGEEVKLAGAEASATALLGNSRLTATVGLFGLNDTSGTLLAFRGWALHDQKATAFGLQPLPTLNAFMQRAQAARTRPLIELDGRPGYYAKLSWAPPGPLEIQAFHYDNRGDPEAVNATLQWGWRTRFDHLGAVLDLTPELRLTAQGMAGTTLMGFPSPERLWVDTRFRSAFLLATHQLGAGSLSGRIEAFGTRSRGGRLGSEDSEDGWAATAAARHAIGPQLVALIEVLHVESRRLARLRDGLAPRQKQTTVQLALRVRAAR